MYQCLPHAGIITNQFSLTYQLLNIVHIFLVDASVCNESSVLKVQKLYGIFFRELRRSSLSCLLFVYKRWKHVSQTHWRERVSCMSLPTVLHTVSSSEHLIIHMAIWEASCWRTNHSLLVTTVAILRLTTLTRWSVHHLPVSINLSLVCTMQTQEWDWPIWVSH